MTQFKIYQLCKDKGEIIMEKTKKNNKGFSLVELIVVVLIMAIIAVSLAPQVMKWVDNSRQAVDVQTKDSIVSAFSIASTDKNVYGKAFSVTVSKADGAVWGGAAAEDASVTTDDAIRNAVDAIYDVTNATCKSSETSITVSVTAAGEITGSITGVSSELQ